MGENVIGAARYFLTSFKNVNITLPKEEILNLICGLSKKVYITSNPNDINKTDIVDFKQAEKNGHIKLTLNAEKMWDVVLFGTAEELKLENLAKVFN